MSDRVMSKFTTWEIHGLFFRNSDASISCHLIEDDNYSSRDIIETSSTAYHQASANLDPTLVSKYKEVGNMTDAVNGVKPLHKRNQNRVLNVALFSFDCRETPAL